MSCLVWLLSRRFQPQPNPTKQETISYPGLSRSRVSYGSTPMSIRWMDGRRVRKDRRSLLMKMGYSIYNKVRTRLADDHNWRCEYCEGPVFLIPHNSEDLATIDHKIPLSRGGGWKRYNLTCACRSCNEEKTNMTDDEYRFYLHLIGRD